MTSAFNETEITQVMDYIDNSNKNALRDRAIVNLSLKAGMCVFHGIRPCIPRTSGHLFHADSATRFEGFCQAVGAKRRRSLGRLIHPPVTVKRGSVYSSPFSLF